jgi:hypothetical protein
MSAPGAHHLICNALYCSPAVAFSKHPNRFVVINDRDYQQIVANPTGRFDFAITNAPLGTTGDPVNALLAPTSDWSLVASVSATDTGTLYLWHLSPRSGGSSTPGATVPGGPVVPGA